MRRCRLRQKRQRNTRSENGSRLLPKNPKVIEVNEHQQSLICELLHVLIFKLDGFHQRSEAACAINFGASERE